MADITPVTAGTAGYVDPVRGMYEGERTAAQSLLSVGAITENRGSLREQIVYFALVDDGDVWESGLLNVKAAFWSGETDGTDEACAVVTDEATGQITFRTNAVNDLSGWVLVKFEGNPSDAGRKQI